MFAARGTMSASFGLCVGLLSLLACNQGEMRPVDFSTSADQGSESEEGDTGADDEDSNEGDGDGDSNEGDGDGDGEGPEPPTVLSTIPTAGATAIDPLADIEVSFSEAMDPATITSNGAAATCSGSVQVSSDDFATCLPLAAEVVASEGDTRFAFTPFEPLRSRRNYQIRVTAFAASASGVELGTPYTSPAPFVSRYYHSVEIDGSKDFDLSDEALPTTSAGFTAYLAWDADYVYLGMEGPDVGAGDPGVFWFAYLGGNPSTSTGVDYQGQAPMLPFGAQWHPRWKADGTYANMQTYTGSWTDAAGAWLEGPDLAHSGDYLELRLSRAELGSPTNLPLVMGMLRETGNQGTFAGVPASAFTDGFDPDLGAHLELELDGSVLPVEHEAL